MEALNVVMQNFLEARMDNYKLYDAHVREFRSDAKGILSLRASCKTLAEHDAKDWMNDIVFCIAENLEETREPVGLVVRQLRDEWWGMDPADYSYSD